MVHACMFVRVYSCIYVCMYVHVYVCMYVCTYVGVYVCMYSCLYVLKYVCTCNLYMCTYDVVVAYTWAKFYFLDCVHPRTHVLTFAVQSRLHIV